jgi:hypothetical protein
MVTTIAQQNRMATPADPWVMYQHNPTLTWWANQALQAPRLALSVWYFPAVAVWQRWCQTWAESYGQTNPSGARPQATDQTHPAPARAAAETRAESEELREAWREYEETRGDWSKSR